MWADLLLLAHFELSFRILKIFAKLVYQELGQKIRATLGSDLRKFLQHRSSDAPPNHDNARAPAPTPPIALYLL